MRATPWWEVRIIGAFMSYWVYQHLGNLSPRELEEDDLFEKVREAENPIRVLFEPGARTHWHTHPEGE